MTLVLIEQYVKRAHELADQVVVLSYGEVALQSSAADVTLAEIEEAYELDVTEEARRPRTRPSQTLAERRRRIGPCRERKRALIPCDGTSGRNPLARPTGRPPRTTRDGARAAERDAGRQRLDEDGQGASPRL